MSPTRIDDITCVCEADRESLAPSTNSPLSVLPVSPRDPLLDLGRSSRARRRGEGGETRHLDYLTERGPLIEEEEKKKKGQ